MAGDGGAGAEHLAAAELLKGLCGGAVLLPTDGGYDAARRAWNLSVDQRPAAIAYPATADEVAEVVATAVRAGLRVAPQGTGHNAGPLAALHDVVLLRTSGMIRVRVDPTSRTARVQAGTRWLDALEAIAPHGLATLHATAPSVGVVGYSLGGGIGWYARALGQHANTITAVELVTAGAQQLRVDPDHDPELFWALRGGGGSFGVVTAMEFALHPIRTVYAGLLAWDWRHTRSVLGRWARWSAEAPDAVTTSLRVQQIPPLPGLPLSGRNLVIVCGAVLGEERVATRMLAPLRELGPELDTFATMPATAMLPLPPDERGPARVVADSSMLAALPQSAVDAFADAVGPGSGSALHLVELRQLGGALGRPVPGAHSPLAAEFLLFASTVAAMPDERIGAVVDINRLVDAMAPYAAGSHYLNFATGAVPVGSGHHPDDWSRLRAVRAAVDPGEVIVANHPIPPARLSAGGTAGGLVTPAASRGSRSTAATPADGTCR